MSVPPKIRFFLSFVLLFSFCLTSCESISLENILPGSGSDEPAAVMVEATFYVQVPLNTPEGEIIYLSTLDEVTGLGVNAEAHPLEPSMGEADLDQGLIYSVTLTVPQHSIIKYRYTRQNQYAVIEHTQADEQVRYRIVLVNNPLEVRDVVSKWSDTAYYWSDPGRISGVISDANTGNPIPGMLVTAGGVQTFTTASGSYMLPGLPPGVHNLVVYAPDGSYQEIQQGAEVASQANTDANLAINARNYVDVTFLVSVPVGTPENILRLAGNLYQLGNTFGNLPGGMNTIPSRMPRLSYTGDNRYGIILSLPVGAEIRYKYSLGDGFWNAEHEEDGRFKIRRILIPDHPIQVDDQVLTWKSGSKNSITFDLWTPDDTPVGEEIYIQFNPYGWTTPLPMTELGPNHWVFILLSPFDIISDLTYRYCREGECGVADDAATAGINPNGREISPSAETQYVADSVESWSWLVADLESETIPLPAITSRSESFITAVEIMPGSKAADSIQIASAIPNIASTNARWVILTPTWSFTHQNPPVIEPDPNQDPLWFDLTTMAAIAGTNNLQIAFHPQAHFENPPDEWWLTAPLDFSWWNSWFDQYHSFAIHFAEAAEQQGAEMLILGGDWLAPALPGGKLADGGPSGVPADSDLRWIEILKDVESHFSGTIAWTMSLPETKVLPGYLDYIDQIHLNWNPVIQPEQSTSLEEINLQVLDSLNGEVNEFWTEWLKTDEKELVLRIAYPSVAGWIRDCSDQESTSCYQLSAFTEPAPIIPDLQADYSLQAKIYTALISTASKKSWISGIISRSYFAPVVLHDKSISIHGKPAEIILSQWFGGLK
jgi:hypothetical protein